MTPPTPKQQTETPPYEPKGIRFFSASLNRDVLICTDLNLAEYNWVCYRHPDGQWVTLRAALVSDWEDIATALQRDLAAAQAELADARLVIEIWRAATSCQTAECAQGKINGYASALQESEKDCDRLRADLAASEKLCDELAEALKQCFYHLGGEIKRLSLNESAALGTQALSHNVAEVLDEYTRHASARKTK